MSQVQPARDEGPGLVAPRPRSSEPAQEILRRSVEYLAFRLTPAGLEARLDPGRERLPHSLERAAQAAVRVHLEVSRGAPDGPSPIVTTAQAAHRQFAQQLAEVKAGAAQAPTVSLRRRYLDALADVLVDRIGHVEV